MKHWLRGTILFLSTINFVCVYNAQTILNAYAKITSVSGASVLSVANVNQTNHTFTVGGYVIVMQMQDNVIGTNTTNASTFGDLSSISNAGVYEVRVIASRSPASGTPTTITLSSPLANTYNTGANSSVQLITYRDLGANYTTTSNITGTAWTGSIGGVVAFYVSNTLTLNHRIQADGIGFRGGAVGVSIGFDVPCTNTTYIASTNTLGAKGEGIYKNTTAGFTYARGKILNGGGGGSENNGGGGGGGNFTNGGIGGLGWTCTSANSGRGLGGISFSTSISASRIFMGGGGGGGQQNGAGTSGANGGGIILLAAKTLSTNTTCTSSILISANGFTASNSGGDGAGGGGAGGSIVLQVNSFSVNGSCPLTVSGNGGGGGNVINAGVHGGGGGGGQGVVIYSAAQPTNNVTTRTIIGPAGADNTGGTVNAGSGGGTSGSGIIASSSGPLPVELIDFYGVAEANAVNLFWKTTFELNHKNFEIERSSDGVNFNKIGSVTNGQNFGTFKKYSFTDILPEQGHNYYRLKQIDVSGDYKYYPVIFVNMPGVFEYKIYPNPVSKTQILYVKSDSPNLNNNCKLRIYHISGELICQNNLIFKDGLAYIDLANVNLQSGIYLIVIQNAEMSKTSRLIVE